MTILWDSRRDKIGKNVDVTSIDGTKVKKNGKLTFRATTTPENSDVKWHTGNGNIATVDGNGVVTGVKAGDTEVWACLSSNDKVCSNHIKITVEEESYVIILTGIKQEGTGTIAQYEVSVTSNGKALKYTSFEYNGKIKFSSSGLMPAGWVDKTKTTAKITLEDGNVVDAVVKYA